MKRVPTFFVVFLIVSLAFFFVPLGKASPGTESLYVDGFTSVLEEWDETGASPWLNDNTANYISTNVDEEWHEEFTFPDGSGTGTINSVTLYIEINGPSARNDYVAVWLWGESGGGKTIQWNNVLNQDPDGDDYVWYNVDVTTQLATWSLIAGAKIKVQYQRSGSPSTETIYVRRAYLYVDVSPPIHTFYGNIGLQFGISSVENISNPWDLLFEPWDDLTGWTEGGTGTAEIDPAGQKHIVPTANYEKYVYQDIGSLPETGFTYEYLLKIDSFPTAGDNSRGGYYASFYDGEHVTRLVIFADKIRWFITGDVYVEHSYSTSTGTWYVWRVVTDSDADNGKVYRNGSFVKEFTDTLYDLTTNDGMIYNAMDARDGGTGEFHEDYLRVRTGLHAPPVGEETFYGLMNVQGGVTSTRSWTFSTLPSVNVVASITTTREFISEVIKNFYGTIVQLFTPTLTKMWLFSPQSVLNPTFTTYSGTTTSFSLANQFNPTFTTTKKTTLAFTKYGGATSTYSLASLRTLAFSRYTLIGQNVGIPTAQTFSFNIGKSLELVAAVYSQKTVGVGLSKTITKVWTLSSGKTVSFDLFPTITESWTILSFFESGVFKDFYGQIVARALPTSKTSLTFGRYSTINQILTTTSQKTATFSLLNQIDPTFTITSKRMSSFHILKAISQSFSLTHARAAIFNILQGLEQSFIIKGIPEFISYEIVNLYGAIDQIVTSMAVRNFAFQRYTGIGHVFTSAIARNFAINRFGAINQQAQISAIKTFNFKLMHSIAESVGLAFTKTTAFKRYNTINPLFAIKSQTKATSFAILNLYGIIEQVFNVKGWTDLTPPPLNWKILFFAASIFGVIMFAIGYSKLRKHGEKHPEEGTSEAITFGF